MRKIMDSRPAGVQGQNGKMEWKKYREKERRMEIGKKRISEKTGRIKSSFIHTVSSNYQCIYSIPSGVPIVFNNT